VTTSKIESTSISSAGSLADDVVKEVRENGVCVVPQVFSENTCANIVNILEQTLSQRVNAGDYFGSRTTQVIYNYFFYSNELYPLFAHSLIDDVMTKLIDKDYVLISPSARNPCVRNDLPEGQKTSGVGWHIDSRVANNATGELFRPSLSYYATVALEPFTQGNSATHYIPKSHLLYQKPSDRNADLQYEVLQAKTGAMIFFDSALWHRAGIPTDESRWSIFNMYGPWFMKPYFRFAENYSREELEKLPPKVKKLLHLNSTPPRSPNERLPTVTDVPIY
jgi:hypothetical protein